MRSDRARRDDGFTLLEVLVAFVIAALALSVLFRGTLDGMAAAETAGRYEEALSRARSHLAQLGHGGALVPSDRDGDEGNGFHWRERIVATAQAQAGEGGAASRARAVSLYAVSVSVTWTAAGRTRSVQLDSERVGFAPEPSR